MILFQERRRKLVEIRRGAQAARGQSVLGLCAVTASPQGSSAADGPSCPQRNRLRERYDPATAGWGHRRGAAKAEKRRTLLPSPLLVHAGGNGIRSREARSWHQPGARPRPRASSPRLRVPGPPERRVRPPECPPALPGLSHSCHHPPALCGQASDPDTAPPVSAAHHRRPRQTAPRAISLPGRRTFGASACTRAHPGASRPASCRGFVFAGEGPAVCEERPRRSATRRSAEGPSQAHHPCGDSDLAGNQDQAGVFPAAQVLPLRQAPPPSFSREEKAELGDAVII